MITIWTMKVYSQATGPHGDPMYLKREPDYIPREGEWLRMDQTPGSYVSREVTKVEYDYLFSTVYIYVSTPD